MSEKLPAGRELDALIAEKVMGLKIAHRAWPCYVPPDGGRYEAASEDDGGLVPWGGQRGPVYLRDAPVEGMPPAYWYEPVPFYSTDIAAAWQVVEKLLEGRGRGWARIIEITPFYPDYVECQITSEREPNSGPGGEWDETELVCAETAPHAICLAALKAMEHSV